MQRILITTALATLFSSCIFSLRPIYTEETLVYDDRLVGDWKMDDNNFVSFQPTVELGATSVSGAKYDMEVTISPGDDEVLVLDGDTITDKEIIAEYYENEMGKALSGILSGTKSAGYEMTSVIEGDTLVHLVKMAKIDDDYYLDLYPLEDQGGKMQAMNFLPVHTFMKVDINKDQLTLTRFRGNKLKDLFKGNQIRLRHEEVEDAILITAQPEEIQKFLQNYSKRADVFQEPEKYKKTVL